MDLIPFNRPALTGLELDNIRQAVETMHVSGDGEFTRRCQAWLQTRLGAPKVLLTTSCTHALEAAALLLDIGPGDEVIMPSFTFVSTANAFAIRGATPVFADIRPDTLNLDDRRLAALVTPRTRAIVPVHYAGVACDMAAIGRVAGDYGLAVVEDNAHGLFGRYRGTPLGALGRMAALSFHETKNVTCGEGGAIVLNDPADIDRAEIIREKGTNRSSFFRGEVDKYTWVDVGSSYLPSDILAAFLFAQLEASDRLQRRRRVLWHRYWTGVSDWAHARKVRLPVVPEDADQSYHMFYLLCPSLEMRQRTIARLRDQHIHALFHYQPLHLSRMGARFGGRPGDCPVTEEVSDRLVRLPFFSGLTDEEQQRVIDVLTSE